MPDLNSRENEFLHNISQIIEGNISNEQFGVSELANEIGMSRSNLLRKVKKLTNLSVSQYIRKVRLQHAKEMLSETSYGISEIAYKVGFSSPSYFIKCFREKYGYPPGGETKHNINLNEVNTEQKKKRAVVFVSAFFVVLIAFVLFIFLKNNEPGNKRNTKSIAVLPFINDSNDSSNVYIINGLMESTLNNLQQIEDLRVVSRTSVEKYRDNPKTTPEIARELNATYLIEGSGQKVGDQILLTIQLIEAKTDNHLWSQQYQKSTSDIFKLQAEVAKNIAEQIEAVITPEEKERIEKAPTENLVAYDYFLKGLDLLHQPSTESLRNSIQWFQKAVEEDNQFARSYAGIAIAYYLLDEHKQNKQFSDSINYYADQALLHDSKLPQSLIAKALFYMAHEEYELAVPYLEKTLKYSPNNDLVHIFLVDLYANHLPNAEKYLEYALTGLEIDLVAAYDSGTASYSYLHISNAFIQSGFINEAEKYINKSLDLMPENIYSKYLKAYIIYAKNENLVELKNSLVETLQLDSTRLDVMQEVAKAYYYLGDYETSLKHYKRFVEIKDRYKLNIYRAENGKIGVVCDKLGMRSEANKFLGAYKKFAEEDQSIYSDFSLYLYYSYKGETDKAIEHLKAFTEKENFHYWTVLFTPIDPLSKNVRKHPEHNKIFGQIEANFDAYHKRIRKSLKAKGLI